MPYLCFFIGVTLLLSNVFVGDVVHARESFLAQWQTLYPDSLSSRRQCQLCHAEPQGGIPWNAYGFDVRNEFIQINRLSIADAIRAAERLDSDQDESNQTNIQEINNNVDPGWKPGNNNFVFESEVLFRQISSPFDDTDVVPSEASDSLCIVIQNKKRAANTAVVCL